ncbi:MAG: heme-binding domain-containing protein [Anaerolineales bacterium]|nr:heme-binding domain-containing protein [Anaerolineales bacterium]
MKSKVSRYLLRGLAVVFVGFVLIQLVPYGRAHENPSVVQEPNWDSPETRALVERACFDCHSNETEWPWYSNIAPVSWLVQHDVEEGRSKLNFSTWGQGRNEADEAVEVVQEGEMPMPVFLIMHPEARLSAAEKDALIRGLAATVGGD